MTEATARDELGERDITIEWLGGNCPVQAEGTFDGQEFYFRARGSSVTVDVGSWSWGGPIYEWPDAGWISEELARAYIGEAYGAWRNRTAENEKLAARYRKDNGLMSSAMQALSWAGRLTEALGDDATQACEWLHSHASELLAKRSDPFSPDSENEAPSGTQSEGER